MSRFNPGFVFALGVIMATRNCVAFGDETSAQNAIAFLRTYCQSCHGDDLSYPGLDMSDRAGLLRPADTDEAPFLVAGKPADSRIWKQIAAQRMPPEDQPQPTPQEVETFKKWIEDGAVFPKEVRPVRPFRGEGTILAAIANDLDRLSEQELVSTRYLSLAHLWNDVDSDEPTTEEDLQLARAGVSKLINSLSSRPRIIAPRIIDPEFGTILAINLRDYGWTDWHWEQLIRDYPYGLKLSDPSALRIYRSTGTRLPYIRADWFCANASRPPLYHTLLGIPQNAKALEKSLGVNIPSNFQSGRLARAAFQKSGVSRQNRMVERHDIVIGSGYYWKSYDMKPGTGAAGDFSRRPLGPKFESFQGRQLATFKHDGGEIIWSLPNGLQAYMLVTGDDARIDQGPPDVVYDPNRHGGSFLIMNGISCMGCHRRGMVSLPKDEIRSLFADQKGQAVADRVLALYPPQDEMNLLVRQDSHDFFESLKLAVDEFLPTTPDRPLSDWPEPVTRTNRRYLNNVDIVRAGQELGLSTGQNDGQTKTVADLAVLARLQTFRSFGLGNWKNGGTISRKTWENAFGAVSRELRLGIPMIH